MQESSVAEAHRYLERLHATALWDVVRGVLESLVDAKQERGDCSSLWTQHASHRHNFPRPRSEFFNTAHVARSTFHISVCLKKVCRGHTDLHQSIARHHIRTTQRTLQRAPSTPATARSSGLEAGTDPMRHTATVGYVAIWRNRPHLLVESPSFSSLICIATSSRQPKVTRQRALPKQCLPPHALRQIVSQPHVRRVIHDNAH